MIESLSALVNAYAVCFAACIVYASIAAIIAAHHGGGRCGAGDDPTCNFLQPGCWDGPGPIPSQSACHCGADARNR
jgi:hypothetical protein